MKVFIDFNDPIKAALSQIVPNMFRVSLCDDVQDADVVLVADRRAMHIHFDEKKYFMLFSIKEERNLPKNARWVPMISYPAPMAEFFSFVMNEIDSKGIQPNNGTRLETGKEFVPPDTTEQSLHVLVIDDKKENRQLAMELLGNSHYLTLASGFREGLKLIQENRYDAVLSDCQMPPDVIDSSLSVDSVEIGQTVHNGLFLIFYATNRGARVAIVTDASHHSDWVSALFDDRDLRKPQRVNGRPVLLINYMGKRWDEALEAIKKL